MARPRLKSKKLAGCIARKIEDSEAETIVEVNEAFREAKFDCIAEFKEQNAMKKELEKKIEELPEEDDEIKAEEQETEIQESEEAKEEEPEEEEDILKTIGDTVTEIFGNL